MDNDLSRYESLAQLYVLRERYTAPSRVLREIERDKRSEAERDRAAARIDACLRRSRLMRQREERNQKQLEDDHDDQGPD